MSMSDNNQSAMDSSYQRDLLRKAYQNEENDQINRGANKEEEDQHTYPRIKNLCIIIFSIALGWIIFEWYYTNMSRLSRELQDDKIQYQGRQQFLQFLAKYGKQYVDPLQLVKRQNQFIKNYNYTLHNTGSSIMKINELADWYDEEFDNQIQLRLDENDDEAIDQDNKKDYQEINSNLNLTTVNWIDRQMVGKVRNIVSFKIQSTGLRSYCASSYALAAAEALQSLYANENGIIEEFSIQQIMECSSDKTLTAKFKLNNNFGCQGGYVSRAFLFSVAYPIIFESEYPYMGYEISKSCVSLKSNKNWRMSEVAQIPSGDPKKLKETLLKGPVTAVISASSPVFKFYSKGIIDDLSLENKGSFMKCDGKINHAVQIVGWGIDQDYDQDYFIVKNSFGEQWGENGFVRISTKNSEHLPYGTCGILKVLYHPGYDFSYDTQY